MKAAGNLLIGTILGAVIGWFFGYLRLPEVEGKPTFLMGFFASIVLVLLVIAFIISAKKPAGQPGEAPANQNSTAQTRTNRTIWIWIAICIVITGLISSFLIYKQDEHFRNEMQSQDRKLHEQSELVASLRNRNMIPLMSDILDHAETELKNTGSLSDGIIARIAAFSFSLKPYHYLEGDSLSAKALSPERGQLLLNLLLMKMDSGSFARIKKSTSFSGADLKEANLNGVDLSGADLSGADLKNTDLDSANLSQAVLKDANLWGANLNKANLTGADLKRSDLRWAELNETDLRSAVMDGAQMFGTQLIKADMRGAHIQWANLEGALLKEANLAGANFLGAGMRKINLGDADLTRADLRLIHLDEANLLGAELNRALVDSNWVLKLGEWHPSSVKEIQEGYSVITDTLDQWKHNVYRLKKIEK